MYNFRDGGQYKPVEHNLRDLEVVQNIIELEEIFENKLKGVKCSKEENQQIKALEEKEYHLINNPFFNTAFGVDNHIYNTPVDLMHSFLCGIIKSILRWTVTIVIEMRLHVGYNEFSSYSNNIGILDRRLRNFPTVPNVPHLYWNTFKCSFTYIYQKHITKEESNATSSGGGFRSSDYLPALKQTFLAVRFRINNHILVYFKPFILIDW